MVFIVFQIVRRLWIIHDYSTKSRSSAGFVGDTKATGGEALRLGPPLELAVDDRKNDHVKLLHVFKLADWLFGPLCKATEIMADARGRVGGSWP